MRKELQNIGYKVRLKTFSHGRHATFTHIETGKQLLENVFTDESLKLWKPLFDFIEDNRELALTFAIKNNVNKASLYL